MAGNKTICTEMRERLFDAAIGSLSGKDRAVFDAHLGGCAACAKEFRRVQTVLQAIDHRMNASLSTEPSPRLLANVRQEIAAQPQHAPSRRLWNAWLAAAGLCAVFAMFIVAARSLHKFNRPTHSHTAVLLHSPSPAKSAVQPRLNATIGSSATNPQRKQALVPARHVSLRTAQDKSVEPEVIVEPGQMQAILRLAAATQSGQVDGAKLLADQKEAAEPLEIKPLVIVPLKIEPLDGESAPASGKGGDGEKDFVAGHLK